MIFQHHKNQNLSHRGATMSHEPVLVIAPKGKNPEEFFIEKVLEEGEYGVIGGRFSGFLGEKDEGIKSEFDFKEIVNRLMEEEELDSIDDPLTMHMLDIHGNFHSFFSESDGKLYWKLLNAAPDDANICLIDWHY